MAMTPARTYNTVAGLLSRFSDGGSLYNSS